MDVAVITSAYEGLRNTIGAIQAVLTMKIDNEVRTKINAALQTLGDAQDKLFEQRNELFKLQEENMQLKKTISEHDGWQQRLSRYKIVNTAGGAIVFQSTDGVTHYACPRCVEGSEIQILQDRRVAGGIYDCPKCKATYPVKPREAGSSSGYVGLG